MDVALTLVRRARILIRGLARSFVLLLKAIYLTAAIGAIAALGFALLALTAGGIAADLVGGSRAADPAYREGVANITALFVVAGAVLIALARTLKRDPGRPARAVRSGFRAARAAASAFRREWAEAARPRRAGRRTGRRRFGAAAPAKGDPPPTLRRSRPVTGRRMWLVGPEDGRGSAVLIAPVARTPWPDRHMDAACDQALRSRLAKDRSYRSHEGPPPVLDCMCGIYALKRAAWLVPRHRSPLVGGRIALTGRVIEGSRGYRAQHAEIVGPLRVTLLCAGTVERELWTPQPATGWKPVRPRPCPFDPSTLAVGSDEYVGLCAMHAAQAEDLLAGVPQLSPLGLQAQLELRYGVEVAIDERGRRWI